MKKTDSNATLESLSADSLPAQTPSPEQLDQCVNQLLDCFGIFSPLRDHNGNIADFRIDYLNAPALADAPFSLQPYLGQPLSQLPPGCFGRSLLSHFAAVIETGQPLQLESFVCTDYIDDRPATRAFDLRACKLDQPQPALAVTWRDVTDRLNKQRTVDEYRQRLELALSAGGMGIWEYHFHTNLLFWAPRTTYLMTGVEVERIVDSDEFWERLHPDDRSMYRERVAQALEGRGDMNTDYRIIRPDGQIRRIATRATILRDSAGKPVTVVGFITDITEQHVASEALARRDLQHYAYFEYAPTSVAMVDNNMRYLAASRSFFQSYGINPDFNPIGKCHYDVFPNLPQRWKDVHARCLQGAVESCDEDTFIMPDGSTEYIRWEIRPWREPDGTIGGIIIFVELITEKIRAIQKLRDSEQKSRALFEAFPQPAWFNYPDGTVAYFNERWTQFTGMPKIPTGTSWLDSYHPADRDRVLATRNAGIAAQLPYSVEHRIRRADGSYIWHQSTVTPLRAPDGALFGWLGTAANIDHIRRAELAADAANKAKDHFLAILSHELRTPLTPVLALAQLLESHPDLPASLKEPLTTIRRNVDLETRLIDDLLDVTRIARGKLPITKGSANLHEIIRQTTDICRADLASKNITPHLHLEAELHTVPGDHARLQQVLWNLLKNAVKFTPPGGSVRIHTRNVPAALSDQSSDSDLLIAVTDTGIGIDPESIARLFKPFEQGDNITQQFGGLGLGLAISKGIIDLHKGSLTAQSAGPDTGSTFFIRLPNASLAAAASSTPDAPAAPQRPLRVLLVDDHDDTRLAMAKLLKFDGHSVQSAATVAQALQLAAQHPFDLLISDIGLPDASGLDLMPQLAKSHNLPGIAVSGFGMEADLVRSKNAGFSSHLIKPIRLEDLRQAIAHITSPS